MWDKIETAFIVIVIICILVFITGGIHCAYKGSDLLPECRADCTIRYGEGYRPYMGQSGPFMKMSCKCKKTTPVLWEK